MGAAWLQEGETLQLRQSGVVESGARAGVYAADTRRSLSLQFFPEGFEWAEGAPVALSDGFSSFKARPPPPYLPSGPKTRTQAFSYMRLLDHTCSTRNMQRAPLVYQGRRVAHARRAGTKYVRHQWEGGIWQAI